MKNIYKDYITNMLGRLIVVLILFVIMSAPVWGQATLPVTTTAMAKGSLPTGFSQSNLGSDYSSNITGCGTALKFDDAGDYVILNFSGTPGTLSYTLRANASGTWATTFTVQESVDGSAWTTLRTITSIATTTAGSSFSDSPLSTSRYIRWIYTTKSNGNVAMCNVNLTAGGATPTITLSSPSQVTAANLPQSTTDRILSQFQATITTADATLSTLAFTTAGTYVAADLTGNFKLWYNTTNSFASATTIKTVATGAAGTYTFSSIAQAITNGTTGFFWITASSSATATAGNTINVAASPTLTFASGTPTGTIAVGGTQTITDVTAPTASTFSPTNGATSVATTTNLVVTFSENIAKGTGNILIKKVSDNSVVQTIDVTTAAVTVSSATLTINPASDLSGSTAYYLEIPATAVKDASNNFYAGFSGSATWSFTTAATDVTAPTVSTFSPANAATSVAISSDLVVTFNENIAKGTGNILIKKVSDNSVVQTIDVTSAAVTISSATLTINPPSDLSGSTAYYVEIPATAVQDLAGNFYAGFTGSATWSFTTVMGSCDTESFTNIPTGTPTSYSSRSWTGDDGGAWSATDARTDQTITSKAIMVRNGSLFSPTVSGGCGVLTVSHKIPFSESSPSFTVWVNGVQYGSAIVPTSGVQTSNVTVNVGGSVSIELRSNGARVVFDDLSWTCYVPCVSPTTQATSLTFSSVTTNSATANYTRGNGDKVLAIVRAGSAPTDPVSGTTYSANAALGSGSAVGSGFAVYDGTAATFNVTSLSAETRYYVNLYEYATATSCYNQTELAGNFWTLSTEPTGHSTLSASAVSSTQIDLTFQTATTFGADGYIILQKIGSAPTGVPTDATAYTVGGTIGDGTIAAIVTSNSATSQSVTGLTAGTTYYYSLIPYNWNLSNSETYNYRTAATIPTAFATTTAPTKLAITGTSFSAPVSAYTAGQNFSVTVQAQDASGNPRTVSTATDVTLSVANGSGSLTTLTGTIAAGTNSVTITTTYDAIESGVQFTAATTSGMSLTTSAASSAIQFYGIDETIFPQYIVAATSTNRVPVAYRLTLSGLTANATYRAVNGCVIASDANTNAGAGNAYFVPSAGNFIYTASTSIGTNYTTFTTDSRGNYTGWFITEPTAATTFTAGNSVYVRITLNDGAGGTTPALYLTTKLTMTAAAFGTGASNVTGIRSTSQGNAMDFVVLKDNTAGTGRPLYCTFIESEGNTVTAANYVDYYDTSVDNVASAWGAVIPNTNANGVRYIAELSRSTGAVVGCAATDADGVWNGVSTVSPTTGTTAKVIATGDAPLTCQPEIQAKQLGTNYNTASTYDFGFAPQSANTDVVFTVKNTGAAALTISSTNVTGTGYSLVSSPAASVAVGDSTTFTVRFNSAVTGTFTGSVSIAHNDNSGSENPYVINFTAKVLPEIVVEQNGVDVPDGTGSVAFGTASIGGEQEKIFVISNTGTGDLVISAPVFGGTNASEFSVVGGVGVFPITIAAGDNTNIIIRFAPSGVDGAHSATFSFTTNDTDENPYNFALTGTQATPPSVSMNAKDPSPSSQPTLGSQNNVLYRVALKANGSTATLQSIHFTTQGTYTELDVTAFKLWVSTNNSFSASTDTEISSPLTASSGGSLLFDGLSETISASDSVYFFVTANIRIDNAASNKTVGVSMTGFSDLSFSGSPTSGTVNVAAGASHTIVSPSVKFNIADASLAEGTGAGTSTYNIALRFFGNVPANQDIVINLSGTATGNGTDYDFGTPSSGLTKVSYVGNVLTLRTGSITTPATINLPIILTRDAVDEADEEVVLTIASAGAVYIDNGANVFTFTITDDDAASVISFASTEEYKGEAIGSSYTVTLDIVPAAAVSGNIVLNVTETDMTYGGTSPDDYTTTPSKSGSTVTVPVTAGQSSVTFTININDDLANTNVKTSNSKVVFSIASVPSNAAISGTDNTHTLHVVEGTLLEQGDLAILGFNTLNASGSKDEISFVCFKDLIPGTVIDITDNPYNKCTPGIASPSSANYIVGGFGEAEGWVRMTFTSGTTIAAGTVITVEIAGNNPTYTGSVCTYPTTSTWTFAGMSSNTGSFNLNNGGEQIFFLQGGTLNDNGTGAGLYTGNVDYSDDLYENGRILYVFNTKGDIWTPTCTNSSGGGTQNSGKPSGMDCFISYNPSGTANYSKYIGPTTSTSKRGWIQRIQGSANWQAYADKTAYNAGGPNYRGGYSIVIGTGDFEAGVWEGTTNTNWFDCRNWQSLSIPDKTTDVTMVAAAPNNIVIDTATAECHNITIAATKSLTVANTGGSGGNLDVYGDFTNEGTFTHTAGVVTMKGSSLAQLTQTSGTFAFRSLDIANSGGVILNSDISANTALTLTSGTVNMNGKKVTLNNATLDVVLGILDGTANGSTLEYTGTGSTNVPTGSYDKLIINRTSSTLGMMGDVTLRGALGTALDYSAGTLNMNSSTLTIEAGVMTGASGVIQAKGTNSDLIINGIGAVGTLRTTGGLDDFTLNRTSSGSVTLGSNLTINDECNLPEGTLNIGSGNTLTLKGAINWSNGGLVGSTTSHLSVEQVDGTTARLILPTPTGGLGNLTIKRLNGMSLFGSLAVAGTVSFASSPASGGIYTTGDTLDLGTTGTITGETANVNTRYIYGIVKATRTVGSGGSSTFGNIGVNVSASPSNLGAVKAYRFSGPSHAITFGTATGIARMWRVKPTAQPSGSLSLSLVWPSDDDNGTNASTSAQVYRLPDGATDWEKVGTVQSPSVVNSMRTASVSTAGFSDWTVSDDINILPVTLVSFTGHLQEQKAHLQWTTASEYQNKGFRIERSADGKHYENIGFVSGVGTSTASQRYGFEDVHFNQKAYYRLAQVDIDGAVTYSHAVYLQEKGKLAANFALSPNPATSHVNLQMLGTASESPIMMQVISAEGRQLSIAQGDIMQLNRSLNQTISSLASGVYIIQLQLNDQVEHLRLVKE